MNIYNITEAAAKLKRSVKTLQRWDRDGVLVAHRTPTNRRVYNDAQLRDFLGYDNPQKDKIIIAYCRVSSAGQKNDLLNQHKVLETFCNAKGYSDVTYIDEIGGGMNFKRKQFRAIMAKIHNREVSKLVIAHKDRLVRFGFDYLVWECSQFGCTVEVLNNETLSPEQEMVQDLMTIVHCFSSRLYGLRNYKKTLKNALK